MTSGRPELQRVLTDALSAHFGRPCVISRLRHGPYAYSTSFRLDELDVELDGGTRLRLICKDLGESGLLADARAFKPALVYEPRREIETYRRILSRADLGTPLYYGAINDETAGRCWLLLEKVTGRELYQIGDVKVWQDVARWLARMHQHPDLAVDPAEAADLHLLRFDGGYYRQWLDRAQESVPADRAGDLATVAAGLTVALSRLAELPTTFVHGEFYPSNILVGPGPGWRRVAPVDWEMAGIGPGILDLAALCTGWDDANRRTIADSYRRAGEETAGDLADDGEFLADLASGQLCLAVQWLGWSPGWVAPPEHTRDWLRDAGQLAEGLLG